MPILATATGTVTVTSDPWPSVAGAVEVTDESAPFITVELDQRSAVAIAERFQRLGVSVKLAGTVLADREIGGELTIDESADRYGDILTLQLVGVRFSPFARGLLSTRASVDVSFIIGSPLNEYARQVFSGVVTSARTNIHPPTTDVTCLDAAGRYAQRRAKNYIVVPNSRKSRLQITLDLLSIGGIPAGSIDMPHGHGGFVAKPFAPGDRPILDVLRDYLGVIGCEIGFIDNRFVVTRYNPSAPSVAELNASNLLPEISMDRPETLSANVLGVVSTRYVRTEPSGERTVTNTVTTVANYAKQSYAQRQSVIGGAAVLTPNDSPPEPATPKVVSEVTTSTTYFGSVETVVDQEEKGWYAFRGARFRIAEIEDPPFYELQPLVSYIFEDGSTRAAASQTFQTIRRMRRTKTLDDSKRVIRVTEQRYFPRFYRIALWIVGFSPETGLSETLFASLARINDDGDGIEQDREFIGRYGPEETTDTQFVLDDDGSIKEEITTESKYGIGPKRPRAANAFGYGVDPRTYSSRAAEALGTTFAPADVTVTTKRYRVASEDRLEITTIVQRTGESPTITTQSTVGSPPRPEVAQADQSSQELFASVTDTNRVLLAGEEIEDIEHNELLESREEAQAYSRHRARLASAIVMNCTTYVEPLIHKWKMVTVNLPGSYINGKKFYVRSLRRDAATFREDIVAHYYDPDLS